MVSFAERKLIVSRMDKQFEDGLKMRKDMNTLTHRAIGMTKGLQVLQKVKQSKFNWYKVTVSWKEGQQSMFRSVAFSEWNQNFGIC